MSQFPFAAYGPAMSGACTLIIETSTPHASIALVRPDGGIEEREFHSDRHHNALLFAPLQELLQGGGPCELGLVLVGSGPGSYSGTRVGIAAAQGVAIAAGCPAVAVPSLVAVPAAQDGAACLAIGDARRGHYWTAQIEQFRLNAEPTLWDAEQLVAEVARAVAAGMPVVSFEDPARLPLAEELSAASRVEFPSATRLWRAWLGAGEDARQRWSAQLPQPIYLKPPHITPAKRPWLMVDG